MNESSSSLTEMTPPIGESKWTLKKKVDPPALQPLVARTRHLVELKLLHRYMSETLPALTKFAGDIENQKYLWTIAWPRKAFEREALLNSMYALAALYWTTLERQNQGQVKHILPTSAELSLVIATTWQILARRMLMQCV
jgi:hypothetical protein